MDEGIVYHPNGEITITFDNQEWRLARPKLKTYRLFSERLQDMRRAITQVNTQIVELRAALVEDGADTDALEKQIDELNAPIWEYSIPIVADMVKAVSGRPLPGDHRGDDGGELTADEWPAWFATSISIPSDVLNHWREVPLAPGAAGTN